MKLSDLYNQHFDYPNVAMEDVRKALATVGIYLDQMTITHHLNSESRIVIEAYLTPESSSVSQRAVTAAVEELKSWIR